MLEDPRNNNEVCRSKFAGCDIKEVAFHLLSAFSIRAEGRKISA